MKGEDRVMMELKALKAGYGDCILVRIPCNGQQTNILIDGGTHSTYLYKYPSYVMDGPLKKEIAGMKENGETIDLLVLTHVDSDHIGGVLCWFEHDFPLRDFVREVWFNDDKTIVHLGKELENSAKQGISLKKVLMENGVAYRNQITKNTGRVNFKWGNIQVLAPTVTQHDCIARKMGKALENSGQRGKYDKDIKDLLGTRWSLSQSKENDASMALLLETNEGERSLLLGDADIRTVMQSLANLGYGKDNKLACEWVKMAHHGSRSNFVPEFLDMVEAKRFVISTDGSMFGHPNKEVVAYLIAKTDADVYFNYEKVKNDVFTDNDKRDYPSIKERVKLFV